MNNSNGIENKMKVGNEKVEFKGIKQYGIMLDVVIAIVLFLLCFLFYFC